MIIPSPHLVVAVAKSLSSYQPIVGKFMGIGHWALGIGHIDTKNRQSLIKAVGN
ncbi:MAG: hypothetical protein V7L14_11585 [Nostoc sp.]|uniref:hypothetical protein n=1 Tax=Nostoc sp. TaxID=1180 RepID=UPI002FFCAFDA